MSFPKPKITRQNLKFYVFLKELYLQLFLRRVLTLLFYHKTELLVMQLRNRNLPKRQIKMDLK